MALQDILAAITAQADAQIAAARQAHQKELTELREESERSIAKRKQEIATSKQQKMEQLTAKAHTHASVDKRNAVLRKKKELLDTVFAKTLDALAALPESEVEPLLRACIKAISGKGEIHPAACHEALLKKICPSEQFSLQKPTNAKGGFVFVSKTAERDCTFEHLVEHVLRPKMELSISQQLFA